MNRNKQELNPAISMPQQEDHLPDEHVPPPEVKHWQVLGRTHFSPFVHGVVHTAENIARI